MKSLDIHFLLQISAPETAAENAVQPPPKEEALNLLDLLMNGGPVIIPISLMFVVAIYLMIERYLNIKKAGKLDANFMATIKDMVLNDNINGARKLCEKTDSPIARMLEKGLSRIGKPLKNIEVAVENIGKLEVYKLEKGMPILATISGAAPMLGFLGTVTGMIITFHSIAVQDDMVTPGALSGGIYQAMVTTVAGLIVGIIAYLGYNLLTAQIEKVVYKMEATSVEFLDLLQQPSD
jgi:biopolymer transport protein ExbB